MLTAIWLVPVVGALVMLFLPPARAKAGALFISLAALVLTANVVLNFDAGHQGFQRVEQVSWISDFAGYHLGVDGISLWLLVLNALLTCVAVAATNRAMPRLRVFLALLLLMEGFMAGVFLAVDLLLFYFFWEAMLIPAYFLLWLWGEGARPGWAALKFVLYTLAGSLLMLAGVIGEYVYSGARSFDLSQLAAHPPSPEIQFGLFFLFAIAFAIKIPVFPFHSWLPDAYLASPVAFLVTFAGIMGKTGAYAFIRIVLPLLPHPVNWWDWNAVMPVLAVLGIAWGALLAVTQTDLKATVAYSSISHMGFIVLGIFAFNQQGVQGAVLQMVNHGIIVPALFLFVAWIEQRTGTRDRSQLAGLSPRLPVLSAVFMIVVLAALGLPGLNSFVGEFLTLLGAWQLSPWLAVVACIGLVLAPVYMLRLFQGVMYARPGAAPAAPEPHGRSASHAAGHAEEAAAALPDLRAGELASVLPLVLLMFLLGLYPSLVTGAMNALGEGMKLWH